jgi:hypothetical protein
MAGTVTIQEITYTPIKRVKFTWTSTAGGVADGTTTSAFTGDIIRLVNIPNSGGTQPTNLYDITIKDADGVDVLFGDGTDVVNTGPSQKHGTADSLGCVVNSTLRFDVTNAGASKGGVTIVYIR